MPCAAAKLIQYLFFMRDRQLCVLKSKTTLQHRRNQLWEWSHFFRKVHHILKKMKEGNLNNKPTSCDPKIWFSNRTYSWRGQAAFLNFNRADKSYFVLYLINLIIIWRGQRPISPLRARTHADTRGHAADIPQTQVLGLGPGWIEWCYCRLFFQRYHWIGTGCQDIPDTVITFMRLSKTLDNA